MRFGRRYLEDERTAVRTAVILAIVTAVLGILFWLIVGPDEERISSEEVWTFISETAPASGLAPEFVYAIAWAESSLNARAETSVARGMMQMSKAAWSDMTDLPYGRAWEWKTNIRISLEYLNWCRDFLERHDSFSYPLLAATYRYGPTYVKRKKFNIRNMARPRNEIYKKIFDGDVHPVSLPVVSEGN